MERATTGIVILSTSLPPLPRRPRRGNHPRALSGLLFSARHRLSSIYVFAAVAAAVVSAINVLLREHNQHSPPHPYVSVFLFFHMPLLYLSLPSAAFTAYLLLLLPPLTRYSPSPSFALKGLQTSSSLRRSYYLNVYTEYCDVGTLGTNHPNLIIRAV